MRRPEGAAQFKRDPEGPRRLDLLAMLPNETYAGRGNRFALDVVAEPADGARTKRSDRDQKRGCNAVSLQKATDLGTGLGHPKGVGRSHERVVPGRDGTNLALVC